MELNFPVQSDLLWQDFGWLADLMRMRLGQYQVTEDGSEPEYPTAPPLDDSPYAQFIRDRDLDEPGRLALILALAPEFLPSLVLDFYTRSGKSPDTGLVESENRVEIFPTFRTLLFLLGGMDFSQRNFYLSQFSDEHPLFRHHILEWVPGGPKNSYLSSTLRVSREAFALLTTGREIRPDFSNDFPARRLKTDMTWADLVLEPQILAQVQELMVWLQYKDVMMNDWGMNRRLKPGFRALFHGLPGTGKTLAATLLGKLTGRDVYRIDLSLVVSKYIGETEKNLAKIFDLAENKSWILFFDEADALFGKRGKVSDARDRYANQEVSFLLQRVEDFNGLVILATNFKANMDEAFLRRFQSVVNFPFPRPTQRHTIWRKAFPAAVELEPAINLNDIAKRFELSGGSIMNVVQYSLIMALSRGGNIVYLQDVMDGIEREYNKEGKAM